MDSEIISSAQNPAIKHLRKLLSSAKYRRENKSSIAEGTHLLDSLMQSSVSLARVICAESALQNSEVSNLIGLLSREIRPVVIKDSLFESFSQLQASVGVMTVFDLPDMAPAKAIASDALLLEEIQDPGNLGTILRTATAAGIGQVYLSKGSASAWSPKALRAGMGAQFRLQIYEDASLLSLIQESSVPVLATDLSGAVSLYDASLADSTAWLFGNEGQGVSRSLLEASAQRIKIPQAAVAIESLNVSAAVAACLFEQYRQRLIVSQANT